MKKLRITALILILSMITAGCAAEGSQPEGTMPDTGKQNAEYRYAEAGDVKRMLDAGDEVIIVDVRTAEEYESGHLPGAVNIPVETMSDEKPAALPEPDAHIIIYCWTGNRTVTAYRKLTALGYTNVYDMGGIVDWPYETVTGPDNAAEGTAAETEETASAGVLSAFKSTDVSGNPVDASILMDKKLTLVNVWATFCTPCLDEMPDLGALHRQYAGQGFQVVGIVTDVVDRTGAPVPEMLELVGEIVEKTKADYLHILPSEDLYGLLGQMAYVPTTIFVDANGRQVGETYVGSRSGEAWAAIIDKLLKEVG